MNRRTDKPDRCEYPRCRRPYDLRYLGVQLCWGHWLQYCEWCSEGRKNEIRRRLGLPPRPRHEQKGPTDEPVMGSANH